MARLEIPMVDRGAIKLSFDQTWMSSHNLRASPQKQKVGTTVSGISWQIEHRTVWKGHLLNPNYISKVNDLFEVSSKEYLPSEEQAYSMK